MPDHENYFLNSRHLEKHICSTWPAPQNVVSLLSGLENVFLQLAPHFPDMFRGWPVLSGRLFDFPCSQNTQKTCCFSHFFRSVSNFNFPEGWRRPYDCSGLIETAKMDQPMRKSHVSDISAVRAKQSPPFHEICAVMELCSGRQNAFFISGRCSGDNLNTFRMIKATFGRLAAPQKPSDETRAH